MKDFGYKKNIISYLVILISGIIIFLWLNIFVVPGIEDRIVLSALKNDPTLFIMPVDAGGLRDIRQKAAALKRQADRLASVNNYLIVNTTNNTFTLYKNRRLISSGLCSTGSLIHLEADSLNSWLFETPKGAFTVQNKIIDPVWRKPDWAFVEEGLAPPPADHPSRFERGVLGDYALDLGDGYLIHGTLYQRLIGQSVTHGCIRLNDEDLYQVYKTLDIGSKVFIY